MTPENRQIILKRLVETYGEQAVFERLGITRRTFDIYLKPKVVKMVPYHKLVRVEQRLKNDLS